MATPSLLRSTCQLLQRSTIYFRTNPNLLKNIFHISMAADGREGGNRQRQQQTNKQTNNKGLLQICDSSGPGRSFLRNREVIKTYVCNMSPRRSKATPLLLTPARFLCSHSAHENMFAEHQFMPETFPHFTRHISHGDRCFHRQTLIFLRQALGQVAVPPLIKSRHRR